MSSQRLIFIIGIIFAFTFTVMFVIFLMTDQVSVIEVLNLAAITYMIFAIGYLYPQMKENDERTKLIRQKGMYYSVFVVLFVLLIALGLIQFNMIALTLTAVEIMQLILSLILVTIWTSWIILSERM